MANLSLQQLLVTITLCVCFLAPLVVCQVTFSRDWNAGKRSDPAAALSNDCNTVWRSVTTLCNTLVKNIHHMTLCDNRPIFRNIMNNDDQPEPANLPLFVSNRI